MSRRLSASVLAACACLTSVAAAQPRPQPQPQTPPTGAPAAAPQGQAPAGGQRRGPRPYRDVITASAVTDSGVFHVHRMGDTLMYEIPRSMLMKEFLFIMDQRGTVRGLRYAGEQAGTSRIVFWERMGNRVYFRVKSYAMRADSTQPVARAVDLSNVSPIIMSFDIAAFGGDSSIVIDVTRLFTTDVWELNARQLGVRVRQFDASRSVIERARSFPRNVEVSALHTFAVDSLPGQGTSVNSMTLSMNFSMTLLPDVPMMARLCDDRVGYFNFSFENFNEDRVPRANRCFIQRYRLEPRDPNARVSDPVEPIVWWIDPATPAKWVPWLIRGVEMWEPVFRAAGFSNAITARVAPTNDPDFDLDDARYSTIRWLPSTVANAYGPRISDPRSGEIMNANIGFYHNITDLVEGWYWAQAGAADPRARTLPLPDSLMGQMVAYVAAHEVGHSIGLRHNMIASTFYPVDSLRSRTFTCRYGTTPSIMDYARNNYVAQPGDNACLQPTIGPYDYFAIDWGYRRIPGVVTPDAERYTLDSLARIQDANPLFRWLGDGDPTDPRSISEAIGDDPVRATTLGLANIRRLAPMLIPAATTNFRTDNYERLNDLYGQLLAQWSREMGHVAGVVGGVYHTERYASQPDRVYENVPRARQQEAVRFLLANAFTTPDYFLDPELLRRLEPTGSVDRIRQRQTALLTNLLGDARLSRLVEHQAFATAAQPAYSIADLFGELRRGLFSEAAAARPTTDVYRRNLQRHFVDQMERLHNTPLVPTLPPGFPAQFAPPPRPADARALARAELTALDAQLRTAIIRTTEPETRAHFNELRARIDRILNPNG